MEYFGYKTKVFEFISDAHTPKNVLVVGVKKRLNANGLNRKMDEKLRIVFFIIQFIMESRI